MPPTLFPAHAAPSRKIEATPPTNGSARSGHGHGPAAGSKRSANRVHSRPAPDLPHPPARRRTRIPVHNDSVHSVLSARLHAARNASGVACDSKASRSLLAAGWTFSSTAARLGASIRCPIANVVPPSPEPSIGARDASGNEYESRRGRYSALTAEHYSRDLICHCYDSLIDSALTPAPIVLLKN